MVLAEIWLEHRRRKFRAKAFDRTFALARAEGCDEGFPETWQRAYALGHKIAYAMGYDKGRSEGFAVGYAESQAINEQRWKHWQRRRKRVEANRTPFDELPPDQRQPTPSKGETT